MDIESLGGTWILIGSTAIAATIEFSEEEPNSSGVKDWLNGTAAELVDRIEPTAGLTLSIDLSNQFTEVRVGEPQVSWFSSEGVLENEVIPFNGFVKFYRKIAYLTATAAPKWAVPAKAKYGAILRYDDGDTKICDRIELMGDKLIRTVNVVTDELYLDRIAIVYARG
jgi:hypothetical protein